MNQKETKSPTRRSKGAILLLTTILLFVIIGMVVSLAYVTVMEQKMSGKTKSSVGSFYNSESGIEWALNKIANATDSTILVAFGGPSRFNTDYSVKCPDSFGTEICKVYFLDQDGKVIIDTSLKPSEIKAVRSVGNQGGETQRAIEVAVASGGTYVGTYEIFYSEADSSLVGCGHSTGAGDCSTPDGSCSDGTAKLMTTGFDLTVAGELENYVIGKNNCLTYPPLPSDRGGCHTAIFVCEK